MFPISSAEAWAVGSAQWGRQSLSHVLCTHAPAKHNIICCAATTAGWIFERLWPVLLIFRNNFTLAVSCASIFTVPQRDFSTWFVGVRGLHREITQRRGSEVLPLRPAPDMVGLAPTGLELEPRLSRVINYSHKSRHESCFWQLLCFVNRWTMCIFSVGTFWEYGKCTLVIRLVSDPCVVSFLARSWNALLFLPSWSWKGPLSHLGPSQPWNRPFCWKFLCCVFQSWLLYCSEHLWGGYISYTS